MPVEFLTDDEAAAYGRFTGPPSQADLDRVFFLDDEDLALVGKHRGVHIRVGFALQLTAVGWLGTFLEDPVDVPGEVLDFVAGQLGLADPSQVKRYTEREKTRFEHQWEIRRARGYREFADAEEEFSGWVAARSRATGDGPKAIFTDGVAWLRERKVLLPGVTTLARLVASVRDETTRQMWEELAVLQAAQLLPDVVVMDLNMPGLNGVEATRKIVTANPGIAVLVVTMLDEDEPVFAAMRAGARGYVVKGADTDDLLRALESVARGDLVFGPAVASRVLSYLTRPLSAHDPVLFPELSDREREVLELLARGMSNTQIARTLVVSPKTIRNHVSNIFTKLQVNDRAEAVKRAQAAGLGG